MGSAKRPELIQTGLSWDVFALHRLKGRGDAVRDIKASLPSWANTARPFKSSVQTWPVCWLSSACSWLCSGDTDFVIAKTLQPPDLKKRWNTLWKFSQSVFFLQKWINSCSASFDTWWLLLYCFVDIRLLILGLCPCSPWPMSSVQGASQILPMHGIRKAEGKGKGFSSSEIKRTLLIFIVGVFAFAIWCWLRGAWGLGSVCFGPLPVV